MNFINHMLKKHKEVVIVLIAGALILVAYLSVNIQAAPPGSQYDPAETLDPNCTPGSANCSVEIFPNQSTHAGEFLTTDGSDVSWAAAGGDGWSLTGNSGTSPITNFIGTTDATDFVLRTDNTEKMRLKSNGLVTLGNSDTSISNNNFENILSFQGNSFAVNRNKMRMASIFGATNAQIETEAFEPGIPATVRLYVADNGTTSMNLDKSSVRVSGQVIDNSFRGIEYAGDYSVNNTTNDRWLVDKGYVDSVAGGGGGDWSLTGNSGLVDATNFIGTTSAAGDKPLNFKVNGQKAGRIDTLDNSFFGYQAGNSNEAATEGTTAFGSRALFSNTIGFNNTAVGKDALTTNVSGARNTAVGARALLSNDVGASNSSFGYDSLRSNSSGSLNTAVGYAALSSNATGNNNTAVGFSALLNGSSGNNNTSIGYEAGSGLSVGSGNIFIGYQAGKSNAIGSNELWIDNADDTDPIIFGNLSTGQVGFGTTTINAGAQVEIGGMGTINASAYMAQGNGGVTSVLTAGTCTLTFTGGILTGFGGTC